MVDTRPVSNSQSLFKPSSAYMFFHPLLQPPGLGGPKDFSGKNANGIISSAHSDANLWANKGYATSISGTGKSYYIPNANVLFNLATESVLVGFNIKKAKPAGNEVIFAVGDAASAQGFYLSLRGATSGKVRPILNTSNGLVSGLADSAATFADASAVDHRLDIAIDAVTKNIFLFCDGILSDTYSSAFTGGTTVSTAMNVGGDARVDASIASATSVDGQFANLHALKWTGGLPNNLSRIVQRISATPGRSLVDAELSA